MLVLDVSFKIREVGIIQFFRWVCWCFIKLMLHGLIQHTVSSWPDHKKMTRVKLKECRVVSKAYE